MIYLALFIITIIISLPIFSKEKTTIIINKSWLQLAGNCFMCHQQCTKIYQHEAGKKFAILKARKSIIKFTT